ncbi:putative branched-chain amino acid permease (azaleucine resistance) [Corynebacterium mustelae]|uniref:Putative branched-chain amino acid permease (Azaleucine resistance) n=1 Tax=Corynebacterium mustelae TaxID=571915 RepID=A0A0G3GXV1_9CORY|nr:AzlC family ABC transporter permease [Corynebacterium mustelae]AKK05999.1 putative branched-chain amino acid permease (azaleucine resistance) [Corynebacterium mustelae]
MPNFRGEFVAATHKAGAVWAGFFAMAIGLGVLVVNAGLPWWTAPLLSGLIFAGSLEFIMIGLLTTTAPIATIAITTFLTNSRHIFYGLTFPIHVVSSGFARFYSVFSLCDESYSIISATPRQEITAHRVLITNAGLHLSWCLGSAVGALFATFALGEIPGLDFVLIALFTVLSIDVLKQTKDFRSTLIALCCGAVAFMISRDHMLVLAMTGYAIVLIGRFWLSETRAKDKNA